MKRKIFCWAGERANANMNSLAAAGDPEQTRSQLSSDVCLLWPSRVPTAQSQEEQVLAQLDGWFMVQDLSWQEG